MKPADGCLERVTKGQGGMAACVCGWGVVLMGSAYNSVQSHLAVS